MKVNQRHYQTIWYHDGEVHMINQLLLPFHFAVFKTKTYEETCTAIKTMIVRGAGAIGAAAGFAMAQAARTAPESGYLDYITKAANVIKCSRPTAYNLFYTVEAVFAAALNGKKQAEDVARKLASENIEDGRQIGLHGLSLIKPDMHILTHCNAGWLAFVDWGSALAPIFQASRKGLNPFVWVGETRPRGQGARLTA
ncbi:MAG: S-methyl-5-thioribose-1-phosphate isomerase, partial [Bacteroidetes bacterium HGW-Bacteroidetes-22]